MDNEEFNNMEELESDDSFSNLLSRFEKMFREKRILYFETDELEEIIDYYLQTQQYNFASYALAIALQQYPNSITFEVFQARYFHLTEKSDKGLKLLEDLEQKYPENIEISLSLGDIYRDNGNINKSISYYEKALIIADDEEKVHLLDEIIDSLESAGQHHRLISYYKEMLELDPENSNAMSGICHCFSMLEKEEEGISYFNKLLDNNSFNEIAWFCLGNLYYSLGLYEKAIQAYDYVLAIAPDYTIAILKKCSALTSLNRIDEAINIYKDCLEKNPDDSAMNCNLAFSYFEKSQYDTAIEYFSKALKQEKEFIDAHLGIAYAYFEIGEYKKSYHHIKTAIKEYDDISELWYFQSKVENALSLPDNSKNSLEKCLAFEETHLLARLDLSKLLNEEYTNLDAALSILMAGIKVEPDNAELHYRYAALCFENSMEKEGSLWLQNALSIQAEKVSSMFEYNPGLSEYPAIIEILNQYLK